MSHVKVGEMTIQKNESGYTIFLGLAIGSDAPYVRLRTDPSYKRMFVRTLKGFMVLVDEEDKTKLREWIKEVEEVE